MTRDPIKTFDTTVDDVERQRQNAAEPPSPGLVLVYSRERPMMQTFALVGGELELGRAVLTDDERTSRRHARVTYDGRWKIADLDSKNGTFLDGERVRGEVAREAPRVLRIGSSLFIFDADVRRFNAGVETKQNLISGPRLRQVYAAIERAALFGDSLFIRGESGSGKELAARAFHAYGGRDAQPFVAVNCAAIPEGVAERLLFGARKGAYSGALQDAEGYVQAADGGTLFLDEIAELELAVQAKLLRVLETREVLALGDAVPRRVELRVCSATHRDLRAAVADGRFREDLYFRLGKPEVVLPPLRDRPEEIAWHVTSALERLERGFGAQASFIEACLLRQWPGNVRELAGEVRDAAHAAAAAGRTVVEANDLPPAAGMGFARSAGPPAARDPIPDDGGSGSRRTAMPDRAAIEAALAAEAGNVTRAAKRLGLHRNQLRRWLEKNPIAGARDPAATLDGE